MSRLRQTRREKMRDEVQQEAEMDMTPMIDVVFLLIIFFLCIDFKTLEAKLPAYLPKDKGSQSFDEEPVEQLSLKIVCTNRGREVTRNPKKVGLAIDRPGLGKHVGQPPRPRVMLLAGLVPGEEMIPLGSFDPPDDLVRLILADQARQHNLEAADAVAVRNAKTHSQPEARIEGHRTD